MTDPVGPLFAAGNEIITASGYEIVYLPDVNNDQLQREGKPAAYYWLPNKVRLARADNGDYRFRFLHFVGKRSADTHVGATGDEEVAGGLLAFSTTSSPPAAVLAEAHAKLIERVKASESPWWKLFRGDITPDIRPAPIVSNWTAVSSLAPLPGGGVPEVSAPAPTPPAPTPIGGANGGAPGPTPGGGTPEAGGPPRSVGLRSFGIADSPAMRDTPRTITTRQALRASNLDPWFFQLQGQGSGSILPSAENAYSALVGSYPAALIWAGFHGGSGVLTVWQHLKLKVWSPQIHLVVEGEWQRIQTHFSTNAKFGGWFWDADVKAEFNKMVVSGAIKVTLKVDSTLPNADKLEEQLQKRSDMVFNTFMDQAKKMIFEPAPFNEKPAEASGSSWFGWGGGVAMKLRKDHVQLSLRYEETRQIAYLQDFPISGQMEGVYDALKADPSNERKYFQTVDIGDWDRKVVRNVKPVVNWPDRARQWVGQPVAFLSAQIGYPNMAGELQWEGHMFQSSEPDGTVWRYETFQKPANEVQNAPSAWKPDMTFVKRSIHFTEPPNATEYPFARVQIEQNSVEIDPDEGVLVNDVNLEMRVDNVGALQVGPIMLNVDLESTKQSVEVEMQALGKDSNGNDRAPVVFSWNYIDQAESRYWMVFTGQLNFVPKFRYRVRVFVKGSIFTKGQSWEGPWTESGGNGPLTAVVPLPSDPGVVTRAFLPGFSNAAAPIGAGPPPPRPPSTQPVAAPAGVGQPPPGRPRSGPGAPSTDDSELLAEPRPAKQSVRSGGPSAPTDHGPGSVLVVP